ncbi:MAG: DUF3800 domain-containing protein [Anaerolineales bacterium]|nr:DUF3800 domain-containing protein [Anaerolineales bacterium]
MTVTLQYAFIDEAGNPVVSSRNHVLIAAALCTETPQTIGRLIRKAQKKYGSPLASGELKAKKAENKQVDKILYELAQEPIEIFSVVVEQQALERTTDNPEALYRWVMTRLVRKLVALHPRLEIVMDQRYTTQHLRYLLEKDIREGISDLSQKYILIRQEDSVFSKELQAVDFVAWALFQKYQHGNPAFYEQIAPRIMEEELVTKQDLEREWK